MKPDPEELTVSTPYSQLLTEKKWAVSLHHWHWRLTEFGSGKVCYFVQNLLQNSSSVIHCKRNLEENNY